MTSQSQSWLACVLVFIAGIVYNDKGENSMEFQYLTCTTEERIATITITREKELNALNLDVIGEIRGCLNEILKEKQAGVVILTGAGRAFVAGADIAQMRDLDGQEGRDYTLYGMELMTFIEDYPLPVIAAVNGFALGGGCELAMGCDIRIASTKAKFGQPEVNLGIIPGFGGTQRLTKLVGKGQAKYMIMTGEMISGEEAYRIGLAQKVVEPEELMNEARRVAGLILGKAPIAIRVAKCAVNIADNVDLKSGIAFEREGYQSTFNSLDRVEGMSAFLEKRPADFQNK